MAQKVNDPDLPADTVFHVSAMITINCPAAHAFGILRDTSTWPEWCSFCPKADVKAPSSQKNKPHIIVEGSAMTLQVRMKPESPAVRAQKELVNKVVEDEAVGRFRVCWEQASMPHFMLRTLRINEFQRTPDEQTVYSTWISFSAPTAYVVKATFGDTLQARMEDWAEELKRYSEQTWQQVQSTA